MSSTEPSSEAAALLANANFYRAFTRGDFAAMSALWARSAAVTCLHPGGVILRGRDAVLSTWRQILAEPPPLEMHCHRPEVQVLGCVAIVTGYEGNGTHAAHLAATNLFTLEEGVWRMVHHQAGPLARPLPASGAPSSNLN
jgi:ketosteroid isomerase-like protein